MTENKHTPGPWIAQFCAIYEVAGMTRIADVLPRNAPDWTPEDYANTRLIAAAPALVLALHQSRKFVAAWTANHDSQIGERMLRKMDAALAAVKMEAHHA